MNSWISHVKAYQAKHGCSYKEALQKSKATYKKGSGFFEDMMKSQKTEQPRFETGGASMERRKREEQAAREAERLAERMALMPKPVDTNIYAGMRKGGSLSSANKAYWKANRDLFNATYGPMSKAAMSLYGF